MTTQLQIHLNRLLAFSKNDKTASVKFARKKIFRLMDELKKNKNK